MIKPLNRKAYGSIGHLPNSRMGPGDHAITLGHAKICLEKARDKHDLIVCQEKLDGSCVAVARVNGQIIPLGRAGWPAVTSPYKQHIMFHDWVMANWGRFNELLEDGERVVGEWLAQAHGTRYDLSSTELVVREPFVPFDIMREGERLAYNDFVGRINQRFRVPPLLWMGGPCSVEEATSRAGEFGAYGALDPIEGFVWRVERKGEVDFLAKYVRPDKVDGSYLPVVTKGEDIWNWRPQ